MLDPLQTPLPSPRDGGPAVGPPELRPAALNRTLAQNGGPFEPTPSMSGVVASPLSRLAPRVPELPGYELYDELGRGGMGIVYRGRQIHLNREVAVKLALSDRADQRELIRFLAEAQAAAEVRHPHVVEVYQFGEHDGRPFLTMEYLPGGTLGDRLAAGKLTPRAAAGLLVEVADGVGAAHAAGIVHRDLKPVNVLFDAAGRPKVADFGLAKRGPGADITRTNAVIGTPAYMAPEQADGRAKFAGPPADVWALGTILYEALVGRRPFEADNAFELLRQVRDTNPTAPRSLSAEVPRDLQLICLKCLSKEPHDRYPTAWELAADLRNWLDGRPITARPASGLTKAWKWANRNRALSASLAGVVAASTAGAGVSVWFLLEARASERDALANLKRATAAEAAAEANAAEVRRTARQLLDSQTELLRLQTLATDNTELERLRDQLRQQREQFEAAARRSAPPPAVPQPEQPAVQPRTAALPTAKTVTETAGPARATDVAARPAPRPDLGRPKTEPATTNDGVRAEVPLAPSGDLVRTVEHPAAGIAGTAAIAGGNAARSVTADPYRLIEWYCTEVDRLGETTRYSPDLTRQPLHDALSDLRSRLDRWPAADSAAIVRLAAARRWLVAYRPAMFKEQLSAAWDEAVAAIDAAGPAATADDLGTAAWLGMNRLFVLPPWSDRPTDEAIVIWRRVFELADRAIASDPDNSFANRAVGLLLRTAKDAPDKYGALGRAASSPGTAAGRMMPADPADPVGLEAAVERHLRRAAARPSIRWTPALYSDHARALLQLTHRRLASLQADKSQVAVAMTEVVTQCRKAVEQGSTSPDVFKLMGIAAEDLAWQGDRPGQFEVALRSMSAGIEAAEKAEAAAPVDRRTDARLTRCLLQLDRGRCLYRSAAFGGDKARAAEAVTALAGLIDTPDRTALTDTPTGTTLLAEARYWHGLALWAVGREQEAADALRAVAELSLPAESAWGWKAAYAAGRLIDDPAAVRAQADRLSALAKTYKFDDVLLARAEAREGKTKEAADRLTRTAYTLLGNSNKDGRGDLRATESFQHAMLGLVRLWEQEVTGETPDPVRVTLRQEFRTAIDLYPWLLTRAERDTLPADLRSVSR